MQLQPDFGNLLRVYGLFMYCFSGRHACLPALHEGMRHTKGWTLCIFWSFSSAVMLYLVVGLMAYLVHGNDLHQVFTKDMSLPWLKDLTVALVAIKGHVGIPLMMRALLQSFKVWPSGQNVKEVFQSSWPVVLVIALTALAACLLAGQVDTLVSFDGALLINITYMVIPCMMYLSMSLQCGWSQQATKTQVKLVACGILVIFGFIITVGQTYLAVLDMGL